MNVGRPLQFDPDEVLQVAMQVFWSRGYKAASLQDLIKAMGLSKSSFYQSFGSKAELFERCISRYRDQVTAQMAGQLNEAQSGWQFIQSLLYTTADEGRSELERRGCMLMNTANEMAQQDAAIANLVTSGTNGFKDLFVKAVRRAQNEGDIPADKDAVALAHYLVSSLSGLKTMVKAGKGQRTLRQIVRVILDALQ